MPPCAPPNPPAWPKALPPPLPPPPPGLASTGAVAASAAPARTHMITLRFMANLQISQWDRRQTPGGVRCCRKFASATTVGERPGRLLGERYGAVSDRLRPSGPDGMAGGRLPSSKG